MHNYVIYLLLNHRPKFNIISQNCSPWCTLPKFHKLFHSTDQSFSGKRPRALGPLVWRLGFFPKLGRNAPKFPENTKKSLYTLWSLIWVFTVCQCTHLLVSRPYILPGNGYVIRIYHECEGGIENPSQLGITLWHHECWQKVISRDMFFYPNLTPIMDSFSCSPLNTAFFICLKKASRNSWIHLDATWHDDITLT